MPPKASKKAVDKVKTKIVEDKTFGLKNKNKSKNVQTYVKQVEKQIKGTDPMIDYEARKKKKEDEKVKKMEQDLFKPIVNQPKAPIGVDPKSVLCEFFKLGMCTKGDKCKFSHNLEISRKSEKIDIYTDKRSKEEDTMDSWDQAKLETVVNSKQGKDIRTDIVCKYFLDAIENKKYGWFWECPNGGSDCKYQHCLPPGFILKSIKKEQEEVDETTLEDKLEEERAKLTKRTPITLENFLAWKEEKKKEKLEQEKARNVEIKTGKAMRSGREMFTFNPELFKDDEDADVVDFEGLEPEDKYEGPVVIIDATGTSIRRIIKTEDGEEYDDTNGKKEETNQDQKSSNVQEELFVEDDIPDISDEEN